MGLTITAGGLRTLTRLRTTAWTRGESAGAGAAVALSRLARGDMREVIKCAAAHSALRPYHW
jgi:hypothetical protein